jgi:hypothetical protein
VVTREAHPADVLVHVVAGPEGAAEVDYGARLDGRGAWLLPRRDVLAQAEARPGILARALDVEGLRTEGLLARVREANLARVLDFLSLAARSGCIASGAEQVSGAIAGGNILAFVAASDASERSVGAARREAPETPLFTMPLDKETLGRRVGKGPRALLCIRPGGPTAALLRELRRMEELR